MFVILLFIAETFTPSMSWTIDHSTLDKNVSSEEISQRNSGVDSSFLARLLLSPGGHVIVDKECKFAFVWRDSTPETLIKPSLLNFEVWDIRSMRLIATMKRPKFRIAEVVDFTAGGKHVIVYPWGTDEFYVWSLSDSSFVEVTSPKVMDYEGRTRVFSHDGNFIAEARATGSHPDRIGCYSIPEKRWIWWKKNFEEIRGFENAGFAFSQDDNELTVVCLDNYYKINVQSGERVKKIDAHLLRFGTDEYGINFSPDGEKFAIWLRPRAEGPFGYILRWLLSWGLKLSIVDVQKTEIIYEFGMPKLGFEGVEFTNDGTGLSAGRGGTISLFSLVDGSKREIKVPMYWKDLPGEEFKGLSQRTNDGIVHLDLDERIFLSGNYTEYICLYDTSGTKWKSNIASKFKSHGIAFSDDRKTISIVCTDSVYTFDAADGRILKTIKAGWYQN